MTSNASSQSAANAIDILNLNKTYAASGKAPAKTALQDVHLGIPQGSMFALLGPNGAGKSTLINILAGLVDKTSGQVAINGIDIDEDRLAAKRQIGIVPQEIVMDPFFSPREALELQAGLYGVPKKQRRTMEILDSLGLADKADAYARSLSGGMKRRLMVAKAMVHSPKILVLDEPTAGVDIELRQQLWKQVRELNESGVTILLTTHYLEEAQELCDRIAVINHGQLVACDTKDNLLGRLDHKTLTIKFANTLSRIPPSLSVFEPVISHSSALAGEETTNAANTGDTLTIKFQPSNTAIRDILAAAQQCPTAIADISTEEADLEDIFMELVRG